MKGKHSQKIQEKETPGFRILNKNLFLRPAVELVNKSNPHLLKKLIIQPTFK
jgi:hypothetical protein